MKNLVLLLIAAAAVIAVAVWLALTGAEDDRGAPEKPLVHHALA